MLCAMLEPESWEIGRAIGYGMMCCPLTIAATGLDWKEDGTLAARLGSLQGWNSAWASSLGVWLELTT